MRVETSRRLAWLALCAVCAAAAPAGATPVGDALERTALATRHAAQSVMLGAAQSGARVVAVGERGVIVVSEDSGKRWQQVIAPVSVTLTAVRFADAERLVAVGHGGVVLTSSDAGRHWTRRLDGKRLAELALAAAQAGGNAQRIKDALRLVAEGADKPLLDVLVFDAQRWLVVGAYGLAFATEDGGQSWASWMERLDNPKGLHLYAARRHADTFLLAGEQGLVLLSSDAGRSFKRLALPYKGSFFTAELAGPTDVLVAGLRGNVWRSSDAGAQWTQWPLPMPVSITGSVQRADGSFVFVNQAGVVLVSRNAGLVPAYPKPLPPLNGVLALNGGGLLALSVQGVLALPAPGTAP